MSRPLYLSGLLDEAIVVDGQITFASGLTVPDGDRGFSPGCIFVDRDDGGTYKNTGTFESCSFVEIAASATGNSVAGNRPYDGEAGVPDVSWANTTELNRSAYGVSFGPDGLDVSGAVSSLPSTENVNVEDYQGIGINVGSDGQVIGRASHENYIGCKLANSDSNAALMRLFDNRDAGLWVATSAGNCQSLNNHCYGARTAVYCNGPWFHSVNDTYADSPIGFYGDDGSFYAMVSNVLFQHCQNIDLVFKSQHCSLNNSVIMAQLAVTEWPTSEPVVSNPAVTTYTGKFGARLDGKYNAITDSVIEITNYKFVNDHGTGTAITAGIYIGADGCIVDNVRISDFDGLNGTVGILVASGLKGVTINAHITLGFEHATDKALVFAGACTGVDITLRIPVKAGRSLKDYVTMAAGWTGRVALIDQNGGTDIYKTDGSASSSW